ncbi:MAG TPA: cell surface protein SprA [Flavobacterium sp.]|nr:cell surface protein SprA [Flavobacterium sp.]
MKEFYINRLQSIIKINIYILIFFVSIGAFAQVVEEEEQDSVKSGYSVGSLKIENPKSIVESYTYDPISDRYIYTKSFEGFSIDYPIILTPQEYEKLVLKESMREYFKKKSDAIDGKKEGSEEAQKDLLPRYYVNSGFFSSLFGSNTIDIKPTGSVEVDLGVRYSKQENPAFSPNNQSTFNFDFDQRISMSLTGKIGTRLSVLMNYDTESTFSFQNLFKIQYTPEEDDIIQNIEIGNVNFPVNSTLIHGAQNLFGVKAKAQFGKTTVSAIYSDQKSQTKVVNAQSGGTIQEYDMFCIDYDADRHFFLSQYFRNNYDKSLKDYPFINNRVQITRVEVWVTNKLNRVSGVNNNLRSIVALQDLGEAQIKDVSDDKIVVVDPIPSGFFLNPVDAPADDSNNLYDPTLIDDAPNGAGLLNYNIREVATVNLGFNNQVSEGQDYVKLENARKLMPNEYTFNPQLGYISLQQRLANDEILAVAYQYTIGDEVYQVGEFGNDGVDGTQTDTVDPNTGEPTSVFTQTLILKLLKSNLTNVSDPIWNIMMKNIYQIPGGYQVQKEDFKFNINYISATALNFITPVEGTPFPSNTEPGQGVANTPLLNVMNVDRLNYNNDPQTGGDGFFDFIPGLTFDSENGRIIFTTIEPFGETLFNKLSLSPSEVYDGDEATYNANQAKYVYRDMYTKTQTQALQNSDKNKFQLKGKFKQTGGEGIPIGAFNVPQGSVIVTAGGRVLLEGVDYSVDYQAGRVNILDPALKASNIPIEVSVENNAVFGQQTRRFMGLAVDHQVSENFMLTGAVINMMEKPLTQKSSYGQESVNNTIFGFGGKYSTEVPFFTRLVNKLPNINTDVKSNLSVNGEVAFLVPSTPSADNFNGESTIYIDDFEGSQTSIDIKSPLAWTLSSTPIHNSSSPYPDFGGDLINDLRYGYKRAKLSWYSIDPIFYNNRPTGISVDDISYTQTRRIYSQELYPQTQIPAGQINVINTLDLTYYPDIRGPYNNNPDAAQDGKLSNPKDNFGGIMRSLATTNFEQANIQYIQMWVLDPFVGFGTPPSNNTKGKIYINLGSISEDVLRDGRKLYENGLPELNSTDLIYNTPWGIVPQAQSLVYAFDTNQDNRTAQDIGLDGMNDTNEASIYTNFANQNDPAGDNYEYFLSTTGGVIERYFNYNGTQGNSPITVSENYRGNSTIPDTEDINRDSTMDDVNAYFEYSIDIEPGMNVLTTKYVTSVLNTQAAIPGSSYGETTPARWIQFRIPITEFENKFGSISDFRSIRFMRMFMTGFEEQVTVRFGALELVRGEWIRYTRSLDPKESDEDDKLDSTTFDQAAVNVYENSFQLPIPYVMPPGVQREQVYVNNTVINENEQSLTISVRGTGLEVNDSRGVFKNVSIDMRQYKQLNMFVHAESLSPEEGDQLNDNEMAAFVRIGNDLTENFYQLEMPLDVTLPGTSSPDLIWPSQNNISVATELLTQLKIKSRSYVFQPGEIFYMSAKELDPNSTSKLRIGIRGNPNLGLIRNMMLGVKNNTENPEDGENINRKEVYGTVWFDEFRMSNMDNEGGMAALLNLDTNFADFANVSLAGRMSTIGFGTVEESPQERSREDIKQYNIITNFNLGQMLPKRWGIIFPFNFGYGQETITPEYDPYNQDILLDQVLDYAETEEEKDLITNRAVDFTKRTSVNFIGVKKERSADQKPHLYDPENITLSYSYNEVDKHNYEIESYTDQKIITNADYAFTFQPKPVEPLKKKEYFKKSDYWKLLSDFNFNYLPNNINFNTSLNRQYNKQQFRQTDVEGIPPSALYKRNYLFNYQYGFNYNFSKSIKFNYSVSTSNIITNYLNDNNDPINDVNLWSDYFATGQANTHLQQIVMNWEIPIDKIPVFKFIKANYTYTGDYNWLKTSVAMSNLEIEGVNYNLGNTVQNSNSHKLNTTFNMDVFYKYIGLNKDKQKQNSKPTAPPKPGEKIQAPTTNFKSSNSFMDGLVGVLTSIKNVQINYAESNGTILPGYVPGLGFWGTSKPTIGFIFGSQADVRYESARNGWLTTYPNFNMNYSEVSSETLNYTANIDLFPDFKIDINADRLEIDNFSEQYDVTNGIYNPRSPYNFGNYSISTILIATSFRSSDQYYSSTFNDFKDYRLTVANELATDFYGQDVPRYGDAQNPIPDKNLDPTGNAIYSSNEGYPIGFGKNNQDVLIPSFLAAYSGKKIENQPLDNFKDFPLPNWTLKYTGLMRLQSFKDKFKRFTVTHGYRSSYVINSYRSNFNYTPSGYLPDGKLNTDAGGNIYNNLLIGNINILEQFNPLIKMDFELKNSLKILAGMNKDRAISMSFDNNLLTEIAGVEYLIGFGYRIKDVSITTKLADNPTGVIKSDINIKCDFAYRDNQTVVRNLDYNNNQLSGGQNLWTLKFTADYSFSKNLTAIFYYDHSYSKAVISTSYPVTNVLSGFTIRYNFGN